MAFAINPPLVFRIDYGAEIEKAIDTLVQAIVSSGAGQGVSPRWLAVKLLEGDESVTQGLAVQAGGAALVQLVHKAAQGLAGTFGGGGGTLLAGRRHGGGKPP